MTTGRMTFGKFCSAVLLRIVAFLVLFFLASALFGCVPEWDQPVSPVTGNLGETIVGVGFAMALVLLWFWHSKYEN